MTPASATGDQASATLAFFDEACAAAARALQAVGGGVTEHLTCAGEMIALRFASPALHRQLMPALAHLRQPAPPQPPTASLMLWDTVSTGVPMPPCPWELGENLPRGEIKVLDDARIQAAVAADTGLVNIFRLDRQQGLYWIADPARLQIHERGAPLRSLLHWWLRDRGALVHAGAVGDARGAVLLAGKGGSGKSTTALTCLTAGMDYLSDDYCFVSDADRPQVHSLFNSAKLEAGHLQRFTRLASLVANPDELPREKGLIYLQQHFATQVQLARPLRAVLLPRLNGVSAPRLTPASAAAALLALAPSSIFQLPGAGGSDFQTLTRLLGRLPAFWLELGGPLEAIPPVVGHALELTAPQGGL